MSIARAVADTLDETIHALAILDLDTLQTMVERMMVLAQSRLVLDEESLGSILSKKRVLELVLGQSELNLNALHRLYGRNMRDLWER